jgi:hypothetical protein
MKYLIEKSGKLHSGIAVENFVFDTEKYDLIETEIEPPFLFNKWNGTNWEEIPVEIVTQVPLTITRMNLKIQLLKRSITIPDVFATIDSIPNSMFSDIDKEIAKIKFSEAVYFDRENADLNLVAVLLGLTQTQLDQIFIDGN